MSDLRNLIVLLAACCGLFCFVEEVFSENKAWCVDLSQSGNAIISFSGNDGIVDVRCILAALADVSNLDGSVVARSLPSRHLDLNERNDRWTVRGFDIVMGRGVETHFLRNEEDTIESLRIEVDKAHLRARKRKLKATSREMIAHVFDSPGISNYSLHGDLTPTDDVSNRTVILIHGYNGGGQTVRAMDEKLTKSGFHCLAFNYPNDGPILDSAKLLCRSIREFSMQNPGRTCTLLSHSMGGLVAREAIESERGLDLPVDQLIMVCPPNHGSSLALLPGGLDCFEHLLQNRAWRPDELLQKSFADGLNEARSDLEPGSLFLQKINQRGRRKDVDYSILLGTGGPCQTRDIKVLRKVANKLEVRSFAFQLISPRLHSILDDPKELLAGEGDGVVSVERGKLSGVEDIVRLPISHRAFGEGTKSKDGKHLFAEIQKRLPQQPRKR